MAMRFATALISRPHLIPGVICSAAGITFAVYALAMPGSTSNARQVNYFAHLQRIKSDDPSAYYEDRFRELSIKATILNGNPFKGGIIQVYSSDQVSARAHQLALQGLLALLDFRLDPERGSYLEEGTLRIPDISLGNKSIYVFPTDTDYSPARIDNAIISDCRGSESVVTLQPKRLLSLPLSSHSPGFTHYMPLYSGWWPDIRWRVLPKDAMIQLECRTPDGIPVGIALKDSRGGICIWHIDLPSDASTGTISPWKSATRRLRGTPDIFSSMPDLISIALSIVTPATIESNSDDGELLVRTECGYLKTTVSGDSGLVLVAQNDEFGEARFTRVPSGLYIVRSTYSSGGFTRSKGLHLRSGTSLECEFAPADRLRDNSAGISFYGFLARHSEDSSARHLVHGGVVTCIPLTKGMERYTRISRTDNCGFYYIADVPRLLSYRFEYRELQGDEARLKCTSEVVFPVENDGPREKRIDFTLPSTKITMELPADLMSDTNISLRKYADDSEVGAVRSKSRKAVFLDAQPGNYYAIATLGGVKYSTGEFILAAKGREVRVDRNQWRLFSPQK